MLKIAIKIKNVNHKIENYGVIMCGNYKGMVIEEKILKTEYGMDCNKKKWGGGGCTTKMYNIQYMYIRTLYDCVCE